jgi:hypothetical protein
MSGLRLLPGIKLHEWIACRPWEGVQRFHPLPPPADADSLTQPVASTKFAAQAW